MSSRPSRKKKRRNNYPADSNNEGFDRGGQISRTLSILEMLAKGPKTTEEIAKSEAISVRTTLRFMKVLAARTPIYQRKKPGEANNWTLDVEEYLRRFKTT